MISVSAILNLSWNSSFFPFPASFLGAASRVAAGNLLGKKEKGRRKKEAFRPTLRIAVVSIFLLEIKTGKEFLPVELGKKEPLTKPPVQFVGDTHPAFSPDGKTIAFVRIRSADVHDLYLTSVNRQSVRSLTSDERYKYLSKKIRVWSRNAIC
jgi:Tol biopolymer transport system component